MSDSYRAREDATNSAMARILVDVATHLSTVAGDVWTAEGKHERYIRLQRADGLPIGLYFNSYKGKASASMGSVQDAAGTGVHFSDVAEWDSAKGAREPTPEISFSMTKSGEQVAKDIARRLLPALNGAWPHVVAHLSRVEARGGAKKATIARLVNMGGEVRDRDGLSAAAHVYFNRGANGSIRLEVQADGSVKISETVAGDKIESVLKALMATK